MFKLSFSLQYGTETMVALALTHHRRLRMGASTPPFVLGSILTANPAMTHTSTESIWHLLHTF